jgi:NADH-quinone oxidoreductase subunit N
MGKVMVFRPALEAQNPMLNLLVVAAVINTAISAYYYLRLIVVMFFRERTSEWLAPKIPAALTAVLVITIFGVLYLGVFSEGVLERFRSLPVKAAVVTAEK